MAVVGWLVDSVFGTPAAARESKSPVVSRPPPPTIPDRVSVLARRMANIIIEEQHLCGFSDEDLATVLFAARQVLSTETALLDIKAPLFVFGDIHGQLNDLLRLMTMVGPPPTSRLLFLGNYVNRSKQSLEVMVLLLCYKILYPADVFLLRGNHETVRLTRNFGFYKELKEKRNVTFFSLFNEVFAELPLCAVISGRILCVHGGISANAMSWEALKALKKPKTAVECDAGAVVDLLWADPITELCGDSGFRPNKKRKWSVEFDQTAVKNICAALDIDLICRGHEVATRGHHWYGNQLVTVYSAPNYCRKGNAASVMQVTKTLTIGFITVKPKMDKRDDSKRSATSSP